MNTTQTKEYIIKQLNLANLPSAEQDAVIKKLEENIEKVAKEIVDDFKKRSLILR